MRDLETMSTVITAAETGHLVFSTLHTNSAAQTIDRIIDSYPSDQQDQVRSQLALVLRAVVSMNLIPRKDRTGLVPAVEILVNSPKISKHIEHGEIKEIHEEMEKSVAFFKMQSMNQSLIALLANGVISYEQAMEATTAPEDLSLKLRKLFPSIEERFREGAMAPSPSDFSEITELLEVKKLYEELEERHRVKLQEKEEHITDLEREVSTLREAVEERSGATDELRQQIDQLQAENQRLREESAQKINQLNERIRELNQRLMEATGKNPSGFFKR